MAKRRRVVKRATPNLRREPRRIRHDPYREQAPGEIAQRLSSTLSAAQVRRKRLIERWGALPMSVLTIRRGALSRRVWNWMYEEGKSGGDAVPEWRRELVEKIGDPRIAKSGHSRRGRQSFSKMPPELVAFFLEMFCPVGGFYVDPFAAQGVQLQVAKLYGVNYYGQDVCKVFVDYCQRIAERLRKEAPGLRLEVKWADSRHLELPDSVGDFCFTSPPYWDIEIYDDDPRQLGVGKSYEEFLAGMETVGRELLRVMKPGGVAVYSVGDMRRNGHFIPYHADVIDLMERAGWRVHDIWILHSITANLPSLYAVKTLERGIAPKVHEYALVFVKPGD